MRKLCLMIAMAATFWPLAADTQERKEQPPVKLLTPADCANITKRSVDEYYIDGPVSIGDSTWSQSSVFRRGMIMSDIDVFDVITRSCYAGKST